MAVSFDNSVNITDIIRVSNGVTTVVANNGGVSTFDYFSDSAVVGDYICFGWEYGKFHNLTINVGTAVSAAAFVVIWEYSNSLETWADLTSYITSAIDFTTTGSQTMSFTVPDDMKIFRKPAGVTNDDTCAGYVRARITTVTTITEGGANATTAPSCKDWTITVDGTGNRLSTIQTAVTSGHWGVMTTTGKTSFITSNLRLGSSGTAGELFIRQSETLELGSETNYVTFINNRANNLFQIGYASGSVYSEGSMFKYYNNDVMAVGAMSYYNVWEGTFNAYNSIIYRRWGGFRDPQINSICNLYNSVFISGTHFYWGFNNNAQVFNNVTFDVGSTSTWVYLYGENATYNGLYFPNCKGVLCGNNVTMSNVNFTGKNAAVANRMTLNFLDCTFTDFATQVLFYDSTPTDTAYEKYTLSISCFNPAGTAITGFSALVKNSAGTVLATGTWAGDTIVTTKYIYGDETSKTTVNYNPLSIEIYANGYKPYKTVLSIGNLNKALNITLQPTKEMITIGV